MVSREFFVLDGTGHVSFTLHSEEPEAFATLKSATARARQLAKSEPGHTCVITQAIAYVTCEIAPPKVTLKERKLQGNRNGRPHRKAAHRQPASHR